MPNQDQLQTKANTHATETRPNETRPAVTRPADTKPADTKPADAKPADAKSSTASTLEQAAGVARSVTSQLKDGLAHAEEEGRSLLGDAGEGATDAYRAAREYALDTAHDVSERAGELAHATSRYARRTRKAGARFVSGNALPLSLIGAGLGWLVWNNMRSDTRAERPPVQPARTRRNRMPTLLNERTVQHTSAPTTTGEKLIGVRAGEVYRDE